MAEIGHAVHSSALIDGWVGLHVGSMVSVAAHVAIGKVRGHITGTTAWSATGRPQARYRASRLLKVDHNIVYVAAPDGTVIALRASDGGVLWTKKGSDGGIFWTKRGSDNRR